MKTALLSLIFLLLQTGLTEAQQVRKTVAQKQADDPYSVRFEYSQSLIFLPVKINGINLLFLLNTGANTTVIDKRIADKLEFPVTKEIDTVIGTAGKQSISFVKIRSLSIGRTTLNDLEITKRNIGEFITLNGQKLDGILGTDILRNYSFTIDYNNRKVVFQKNKIVPGKKKAIPFDMVEGIPRLEMRLSDTFNTFVHFNSGVSLQPSQDVYVNVSPKQWEALKSCNQNLEHTQYLAGTGVGGGIYLQAVKVSCLELNQRLKIFNGHVIIQPKEGYFKNEDAIGFFGNNLLEKYGKVSVDFLSRQIILPMDNQQATKGKSKRTRRT